MFKFEHMTNVFEKPIIGQSLEEMEDLLTLLNEKRFRGRQIFDWVYRKRIYDFSKMSDLPITLREKLDLIKIHPLKEGIPSPLFAAHKFQRINVQGFLPYL